MHLKIAKHAFKNRNKIHHVNALIAITARNLIIDSGFCFARNK